MKSLLGSTSDKSSLSGLIRPEENSTYRTNISDLNTFRYIKQSSTIGSGLYFTGIAFSSDGKIMYLVDIQNDAIYQYSLSTPWDMSSVTYTNKSLSISTKSSGAHGVKLSNDGTRIFIVDVSNRNVFEYELKTPWDLSTGVFTVNRMAVSTQELNNTGIFISSDGTKLYSIGTYNDCVVQHNLNVAYDISQGFSSTSIYNVNAQDNSPYGIFFKPDGTKFYMMGGSNRRVYQYSLSTPWSITSATYDNKFYAVTQDTFSTEVSFSVDGTKMYVVGNTNNTIYQYSLSTAWDASTASYDNKSISVLAQDDNPSAISFKPDGKIMYVGGYGTDRIYQYALSVAWDISTATYSNKFVSISNEEPGIGGLIFNPSGTILYIVGDSTTDYFNSYKLEIAWDISSTNIGVFSVANQDLTPRDLCFNSTGTKLYVLGEGNDRIYQYSLTYPFRIFSASYDNKFFGVASQDTVAEGIILNSTNNRLYLIGSNVDTIYEYSLSTPGDISTASYTGKSINISFLDSGPTAIDISKDDSKLFVVARVNSKVLQINSSVFS